MPGPLVELILLFMIYLKPECWSTGVLGSIFRYVLRVTSHALQSLLQYFNPEPGTRNSKRFNFDTPIRHRSTTPLLFFY
jgi:hypothetical protein